MLARCMEYGRAHISPSIELRDWSDALHMSWAIAIVVALITAVMPGIVTAYVAARVTKAMKVSTSACRGCAYRSWWSVRCWADSSSGGG